MKYFGQGYDNILLLDEGALHTDLEYEFIGHRRDELFDSDGYILEEREFGNDASEDDEYDKEAYEDILEVEEFNYYTSEDYESNKEADEEILLKVEDSYHDVSEYDLIDNGIKKHEVTIINLTENDKRAKEKSEAFLKEEDALKILDYSNKFLNYLRENKIFSFFYKKLKEDENKEILIDILKKLLSYASEDAIHEEDIKIKNDIIKNIIEILKEILKLPRTKDDEVERSIKKQISILEGVIEEFNCLGRLKWFDAENILLNIGGLIDSMKCFDLIESHALDIYSKMRVAYEISKDLNGEPTELSLELNQAGELFIDSTQNPQNKAKAYKFQQKIDKIKAIAAKDAKKWKISQICSWIKYKFKSLLDKLNFRGKSNRAIKYQVKKVLEYSKKASIITAFESKKAKKIDAPKVIKRKDRSMSEETIYL